MKLREDLKSCDPSDGLIGRPTLILVAAKVLYLSAGIIIAPG